MGRPLRTRLLPLARGRCRLLDLLPPALTLVALALALTFVPVPLALTSQAQARPYPAATGMAANASTQTTSNATQPVSNATQTTSQASRTVTHAPRSGVRASAPSPRALASALEQTTGLVPSAVTTKGLCAPAPPGIESCAAQVLVLRSNHRLVRPHIVARRSGPLVLPTRAYTRAYGTATRAYGTPTLAPPAAPAPDPGTPAYIQQAYDLAYLSQTGGVGDTVAIVDAYNDPTAESDLAVFRSKYGLPPCTTANGCFQKLNQTGGTSPMPAQDLQWEAEIALDLDAVSAICPNCKIKLIEANNSSDSNLTAAESTAAASGAKQVTNSWGGSTPLSQSYFTHPGVSFVAAGGDHGYETQASYPASLPNVTAAGGTSLASATDAAGARGFSESAWSLDSSGWGAGAGCNTHISKPAYQTDSGCNGRSYADLSADADPSSGLGVYDTANGGWLLIGGTSLSSPLIAGYYAITGTDGSSPAWAYTSAARLNDPVSGSVGDCPLSYTYICTARAGYDGPTGVGSISGAIMPGAPGIGGPSVYSDSGNTYVESTSGDSATLVGGVYPNGLDTTYFWEYGTTSSYDQQTDPVGAGSGWAPVSTTTTISGLTAGDTYHYRLVAENSAGTTYGYDYTMTASPSQSSLPPVETPPQPSPPPTVGSGVLYNVSPPAVSGVAREGQTLSASAGDWVGDPTSIRYQWETCQGQGYACYDIAGATGTRLRLSQGDIGRALRVVVTASNRASSFVAISGTTAAVRALPPPPAPRISSLRLGSSSFTAKKGTVLTLTLSAGATVELAVSRRVTGRKVKHQCRPGAGRGRRCTTTLKAAAITFHGSAGFNSFMLRLRHLAPGRYRATVTAHSSSGTTTTGFAITIVG